MFEFMLIVLSQYLNNIVTRHLTLSFLMLLFCGCEVVQQPPPQIVKQPIEVVDNPVDNRLNRAQQAFEQNHLTTPEESSAFRFYNDVLNIDPQNAIAQAGIANIVEQYLTWALDNAQSDHYDRARQYVRLAQSVDASHPNIQPILQSIDERERAIVTSFDLNAQEVRARRVSKLVLRHIARQIEPGRTFVTIRAQDDASGRWLYQELNKRVDSRIQAEFEIGNQPRILLSH